jgi:hypothetical protein
MNCGGKVPLVGGVAYGTTRVSTRVLVVSSKAASTSFLSDFMCGIEATSPPLRKNSKY